MAATFFKTARTFAVVGASNDRSKVHGSTVFFELTWGYDSTGTSSCVGTKTGALMSLL